MSLNIIDPKSLVGNCCYNGSLFVKYNTNNNIYFSHYIPKDIQDNYEIYCVYRACASRQQDMISSLRITPININSFEADNINNTILFLNNTNEDPRVLCINDKLFVSYSKIFYPLYRHQPINIKINGIFLNHDFKTENIITFDSLNNLARRQKNWSFFINHDITYILYNIMPLQIYIWDSINSLNLFKEALPIVSREWKHPKYPNLIFRGGSQPILIDNEYYIFIHSTNYYMFCIIIDPDNFDILKITEDELIPKKYKEIHFPCGVIYDENNKIFYVSLGINDIKLGIYSISKIDLDKKMIKVNNFNSVIIKDDIFNYNMKNIYMNVWINSWGGSGNDLFSNYLYNKNIICKSSEWDKIGCHYLKYSNINIKKIYIITDPLIAIASMIKNNNLITNFNKLSNQQNNNIYTISGLLYFMWIQLKIWSSHSNKLCSELTDNKNDVLIIKEKNIRNNKNIIEEFINIDKDILINYPEIDKFINSNVNLAYDIINKEKYTITKILLKNIIELYNKI